MVLIYLNSYHFGGKMEYLSKTRKQNYLLAHMVPGTHAYFFLICGIHETTGHGHIC